MSGPVAAIWKTTSRRNTSFYRALITALRLYAVEKFSWKEIVGYAIYLPEISREMPVMISKQESLAKLARINPRDIEERVENKSLFYEACKVAGLPVPKKAMTGIMNTKAGMVCMKSMMGRMKA